MSIQTRQQALDGPKRRAAAMGRPGMIDKATLSNPLDAAVDALIRQFRRSPVTYADFGQVDLAAGQRSPKEPNSKAEEVGQGHLFELATDPANPLDIACDGLIAKMHATRRI